MADRVVMTKHPARPVLRRSYADLQRRSGDRQRPPEHLCNHGRFSYEERIDTVTGPRSRNARLWQVGQLAPEAR
jgi:hypothetical protein